MTRPQCVPRECPIWCSDPGRNMRALPPHRCGEKGAICCPRWPGDRPNPPKTSGSNRRRELPLSESLRRALPRSGRCGPALRVLRTLRARRRIVCVAVSPRGRVPSRRRLVSRASPRRDSRVSRSGSRRCPIAGHADVPVWVTMFRVRRVTVRGRCPGRVPGHAGRFVLDARSCRSCGRCAPARFAARTARRRSAPVSPRIVFASRSPRGRFDAPAAQPPGRDDHAKLRAEPVAEHPRRERSDRRGSSRGRGDRGANTETMRNRRARRARRFSRRSRADDGPFNVTMRSGAPAGCAARAGAKRLLATTTRRRRTDHRNECGSEPEGRACAEPRRGGAHYLMRGRGGVATAAPGSLTLAAGRGPGATARRVRCG